MKLDEQVFRVQQYYPRIYMACHTEHVRAPSSEAQLSARDGSILAHLTDDEMTSQADLARHLKVTPATLSEALKRLGELGYVTSEAHLEDERRRVLALTDKGREAMRQSSVLDRARVTAVLERLSPEDRERAVEGLRLLASAAASP